MTAAQPRTLSPSLVLVPVLVAFVVAFAVGALMSRPDTAQTASSAPAAERIDITAPEVNNAGATHIGELKVPAPASDHQSTTDRGPATDPSTSGQGTQQQGQQTQTQGQQTQAQQQTQTQQQQTQQQTQTQQHQQQQTQQQNSNQNGNDDDETSSVGTE